MPRRRNSIVYLRDYRIKAPAQPPLLLSNKPQTTHLFLWEGSILLALLSVGAVSLFIFNSKIHVLIEESALFIN